MQIMAIFYSIIYIQYGAYTHHIIIGHSCVEYKEEVFVMIVYDRLWITLKKKNISQYALIKDYGIDKAQFDIVNIGLHFILKNVRPYAASCSEA